MYSDLKVNEITPLLGDFKEVPHPDGKGLVLIQRASDSKHFTVSPDGQSWWSDDKGSWQRFNPQGGGVWYAYREDTNRLFFIARVPKQPYQP